MGVVVAVPWRPGCPHREAAWEWVRSRYEALGWSVVTGTAPDGPWCKALAVRDALQRTGAAIVVVADADCWSDGTPAAVDAVRSGAAWAKPHDLVHRLTPEATTDRLAGGHSDDVEVAPYPGMDGGGICVLERTTYDRIPLDPRFQGWGGEDAAWGRALRCLLGDPALIGEPLWHFWHPPQPDAPKRRGLGGGRFMNDPNRRLLEQYKDAHRRPDRMTAVIDAAKEALQCEPASS